MSDTGIPAEIEHFLTTQIKSLEQLEILLLLSESSDRLWTIQAIYEVVKSSEASIRERLREWCAQGFLKQIEGEPPQFQFAPSAPQLAGLVERLAVAYKERRVKIVQLIYSQPASAAEEFAKAFRLRKE